LPSEKWRHRHRDAQDRSEYCFHALTPSTADVLHLLVPPSAFWFVSPARTAQHFPLWDPGSPLPASRRPLTTTEGLRPWAEAVARSTELAQRANARIDSDWFYLSSQTLNPCPQTLLGGAMHFCGDAIFHGVSVWVCVKGEAPSASGFAKVALQRSIKIARALSDTTARCNISPPTPTKS
jgi:hypothetical protein